MKKIYVAGKLNDGAVGYIQNLHTMIAWDIKIREQGFSVFNPCIDVLTGIVAGNFDYKDYFENNLPWLAVADALFLLPNWETSEGAKKEIDFAMHRGIPIFNTLSDLIAWRAEATKNEQGI